MLSILVMCSIDMEKYADLVGRGYLIELREVKEKRKKILEEIDSALQLRGS